MENHDNNHNLSWQIFHTVQRYDNNGKTFKEQKCINDRLFPLCDQCDPLNSCFLFLSHDIWQSNDVVVKIYVAKPIEQALIEYLKAKICTFVANEETFAFNVERCSCVPVKGCHQTQEHVAHNNHHHGVELTIAKAVSKEDKDEKS